MSLNKWAKAGGSEANPVHEVKTMKKSHLDSPTEAKAARHAETKAQIAKRHGAKV
jgi:hypothetical protein